MNQLKRFCIIGVIFTSILGIISHFVYEWSGNNFFVGLFFPVNESTWEHMKLIFFPMLIYSLVAKKYVSRKCPCILNAMFIGIIIGLISIPVIFYTYSGILGFNVAWLNIAIYIISVIIAYVAVYRIGVNCCSKSGKVSRARALRITMYLLLIAFMVFTVYPPKIGLFENPLI